MATTMRRRSSPRGSAPRRKRIWARNDEIVTGVLAAGSVFDLAGDFATEMGTNTLPVGCTVRGILLDFGIEVTTAGNTTSGITIGVIALDQNVSTDVPTPVTQDHADWMWWQFIHTGTSAIGSRLNTFDSLGGPIRMGAQRKISELGTTLWFVAQADGGVVVNARFRTSTLLLLP